MVDITQWTLVEWRTVESSGVENGGDRWEGS